MVERTIRHYEVGEALGQGGMGVVYRAKDTRLGRPVALKVLPAEFTRDPDRKARFIQEARAAAAVNHPAIAQIYDVDEDESGVFIAMELVPGKTVKALIQGRELDLPVEPVGVDPRDQLRWKHFDYHLAPERTLLCDKDARHAAAAQFALERIGRAEGVLKLAALIHYGAA